ncbi:MAG: hypothetical protein WC254_04955 [Candidatus Woesearchaeota archaeon]|jgi:hypothetical protein
MNKKTVAIIGIIILIIIGIILYFLLRNPCSSIKDSSQQADCYTELAVSTGNIKYCTVNYYTQDCLKKADPQYNANKETATDICQKVSDSSKREECLQYVNMNY